MRYNNKKLLNLEDDICYVEYTETSVEFKKTKVKDFLKLKTEMKTIEKVPHFLLTLKITLNKNQIFIEPTRREVFLACEKANAEHIKHKLWKTFQLTYKERK